MAKPKPVNWELINANHGVTPTIDDGGDTNIHNLVQELIDKYHSSVNQIGSDNIGLNFVLMWRLNVKMDADGYVVLADVTKSSDQNRELYPHDVIIGINKDAWSVLDVQQRKVVIDAQLERIAVCLDKDDNPKEDDRNRVLFRLRRIEVMDESTLLRRHGKTLKEVQDYIQKQFETGGAEDGSYVAETLSE